MTIAAVFIFIMRQDHPALLSSNPFYATRQDRVALARERYFERGERPSGLVPEPVLQSWTRCLGASRSPDEKISFDPVSKTRTATLMTRNRALIDAARDPIAELENVIAGSQVRVMLTCSEGVVLMVSRSTPGDGPLLQSAARVGVNIAEDAVGTVAPGVTVRTGEVCHVRGGEHFFRCLSTLHCAAAPVRDASGRTVAMLNLSSEAGPFRFDVGAMAHMYATSIENRLLLGAARIYLLLRFQSSLSIFNTPLEGLAAIDDEGRVRWFNGIGSQFFDCPRRPIEGVAVEEVFGLGLSQLLELARNGRARPQMLPTGLTLWMEAHLDERLAQTGEFASIGPDVAEMLQPVAESQTSLGEANRGLIEQALAQCQGNISRAARMLGVSRGLLYRRLRDWGKL